MKKFSISTIIVVFLTLLVAAMAFAARNDLPQSFDDADRQACINEQKWGGDWNISFNALLPVENLDCEDLSDEFFGNQFNADNAAGNVREREVIVGQDEYALVWGTTLNVIAPNGEVFDHSGRTVVYLSPGNWVIEDWTWGTVLWMKEPATPTPDPTETSEPTSEPEPTEEPTKEPTAEPTETPEPTQAPAPEDYQGWEQSSFQSTGESPTNIILEVERPQVVDLWGETLRINEENYHHKIVRICDDLYSITDWTWGGALVGVDRRNRHHYWQSQVNAHVFGGEWPVVELGDCPEFSLVYLPSVER